ncbi:MAG: tetratricopeptide repeat protein, partial [Myxococcales bacterium]|nr:tetratricopeptide repeat protein [Myxococcales bacterium]
CKPVKEDSRFLPEAWTRVGEYHFDNSELELAIAAYTRVLDFKDSPYFDKALYKLAWSYYRADNYPEAIKRFDELVVFSDKKKAESGGEGSDLRTESVQYLGISFAEKDWNGDSIDDAETGLERAEKFYRGRENEPHVRDIFAKLGDIYFDETEYFRAIEVYKRALAKWPYDPDNPKLQDRVVMAFERQRDFTHALTEREMLARNYTRGTEWYKHNRDNEQAIQTAQDLAELALVSAAVNHHKAAQDLKKMAAAQKRPDPKLIENIQKEYKQAAEAYEKYLEQYPNSRNTYEYSYSYAETLYYSGRFRDAAMAYEKVRDSKLDNKYVEDAAFNAVKSYEMALAEMAQKGAAGNAILVTYTIEKNLDKIEEWANRLKAANCGSTLTAQKNAAELGKLSLGVKFQKADQLFADKKYEQAAKLYVEIVDRDPHGEDADKALNNAAVAYENVKRYAAATRLYERIVNDYPNSKFVDDALFRTAVSYQKAFEFDKAAISYLRLAEDKRFAGSTHRTDALYNAAIILENDQNYLKAADLFKRYSAEKGVKREDASDAFFRAGVNYEKLKDYDKANKTFNDYVKFYGMDPKGKERVLEAWFRIAQNDEARHDKSAADALYRKIVAQGASAPPASEQAEYAAHAAFILTEEKLPAVEHSKISGGGKKLAASIQTFKSNVGNMVSEYNKVIGFRRATWTTRANAYKPDVFPMVKDERIDMQLESP